MVSFSFHTILLICQATQTLTQVPIDITVISNIEYIDSKASQGIPVRYGILKVLSRCGVTESIFIRSILNMYMVSFSFHTILLTCQATQPLTQVPNDKTVISIIEYIDSKASQGIPVRYGILKVLSRYGVTKSSYYSKPFKYVHGFFQLPYYPPHLPSHANFDTSSQ